MYLLIIIYMEEAFKWLVEIYSKLPLWMYLLVITAIVIKIIDSRKKRKKFQINKDHIINDYKVDTSEVKEPKRRQFEKEVASIFKENWWEVKLWPWYNDWWKDIVVRKWLAIYLVQCKHYRWTWFVWPSQIRDFQWAIDLYEKKNGMTVRWIFITSWKTTSKARDTAKMLSIELRDKYNWRDNIKNL